MKSISFRKSIGTSILISTLLIPIIAITLTGVLAVRLSQNVLRKSISERNLQIARRASSQISQYIGNAHNTLASLAEILATIDRYDLIQEIVLENLSMNLNRYADFYILNREGKVLAGSSFVEKADYLMEKESLTAVLEGNTYVSQVMLTEEGLPYILFALPIRVLNRVEKVLVADLNLRDIWDLIDDIVLGETGRARLFSKYGTLIAHPDKSMVLTTMEDEVPVTSFSDLTMEGMVQYESGIRRRGKLIAYMPVKGIDWIVSLEQSIDEAYRPLGIVWYEVLGVIAVAIAFAIFASYILAQRVSKPLRHLLEGSRIIGMGNLEHSIKVEIEDEIGSLSHAFNEMVTNLRERSKALYESEEKYRLLTENVRDIIFALDEEGRFLFINQRAETITGRNRSDFIGNPFVEFLTPDSREAADKIFRNELKESQGTAEGEVVLQSKGGENLDMEVRLVRVSTPDGRDQFYGVARNVTERKRLQEQLIQSDKLSSIGELVSGVAHEVNNPLTGILGFTELILMEKNLGPKIEENLRLILAETERARRIVQNLLTFARMHPLEKRICQINDIIESVLDIRSYEMEISNIEVVRKMDPDLPLTMADPHQMRQVFLNLLNNAIQALKSCPAKRTLSLITSVRNGKITAILEDTGPGIPKQNLTRLFDPFFTTKPMGKGTGLGLSITHGIVREHGGKIYAENMSGAGARFVVELPLERVIKKGQESFIPPSPLPLPHLKVLAVDDEKSIRKFLDKALQKLGCLVDEAENGEIALNYMKEKEYDLIISDLRMPGIDGWELYAWVKKHRPHLAKKLVFITGDIINLDAQTFFQETGVLHLKKPFHIEDLKRIIRLFEQ